MLKRYDGAVLEECATGDYVLYRHAQKEIDCLNALVAKQADAIRASDALVNDCEGLRGALQMLYAERDALKDDAVCLSELIHEAVDRLCESLHALRPLPGWHEWAVGVEELIDRLNFAPRHKRDVIDRPPDGMDGLRDVDHACYEFKRGTPSGDCESDGHHLCSECAEMKPEEEHHG
jgi:hypothetical protein